MQTDLTMLILIDYDTRQHDICGVCGCNHENCKFLCHICSSFHSPNTLQIWSNWTSNFLRDDRYPFHDQCVPLRRQYPLPCLPSRSDLPGIAGLQGQLSAAATAPLVSDLLSRSTTHGVKPHWCTQFALLTNSSY